MTQGLYYNLPTEVDYSGTYLIDGNVLPLYGEYIHQHLPSTLQVINLFVRLVVVGIIAGISIIYAISIIMAFRFRYNNKRNKDLGVKIISLKDRRSA
jgi:hypothetical protein